MMPWAVVGGGGRGSGRSNSGGRFSTAIGYRMVETGSGFHFGGGNGH